MKISTQSIYFARLMTMAAVAACGDDPKVEPELEPNVVVERRLQTILEAAANNPNVALPGSILHYRSPEFSTWSGAAGFGDLQARVPMRPHDRFRAGSIPKTFLAVVTLQHVEEGTLSLDQTLPELLPAAIADRIEKSDRITLRMLLSHRSGIPEWTTQAVHMRVAAEPGYIWTTDEALELASQETRAFEPGESFEYSNTNYTVIGLVLEQVAGKSWREQVRERVIERLGLEQTSLPEPGDTSTGGEYAHGYEMVENEMRDFSMVDPSMAGASGGNAMITNAEDLGRFLDALLAGELFADARSLIAMTTMAEGGDPSGLPHFYGLGLESYILPGGTTVIGHSGGAAGYSTMMFHIPARRTTIVASSNSGDFFGNALEVFLPAIDAVVEPVR
jgi:D-alanyl-D-alanine carboxypeptidase